MTTNVEENFDVLDDLDELLGMDDRPVEWLNVPEWKRKVRLRGMTSNDRDAFEQQGAPGPDGKANIIGLRAKMVAACWVKEDGSRVVPPSKETALGNMGAKGLDRVFQKCAEMNGMTETAQEEAKENFADDQSENSTSD